MSLNRHSASMTPVLDREFLEVRNLLLQLAAALDRVERQDQTVDDVRWERIANALEILEDEEDNRAERVQLVFSRSYSDSWRSELGVTTGRII